MKLKLLTEFRKDEHGGILAFYVVMFLLMMVGGGMSIDFMRHEIKREALQDALDRGVLAAAGNAQSSITGVLTEAQTTAAKNAATATVRSYISLAGFDPDAEGVVINPIINATTQKVIASSSFNVDTYFLRLSGIDVLNGAARAGAEVGAQKIEMSLVLDISGSMDTRVIGSHPNGGASDYTRLDLLQVAAKQFAATILSGDRDTYTSISVVPFSGQVSISDSLADEYNNFNPWHNYSNCMEFNDADYSTTAFGPNEARNQYQHFYMPGQRNGGKDLALEGDKLYEWVPWCPASNLNVLPLSNNIDRIEAVIDGLTPQGPTNTWTGIKWGAALLDHSMQPIINQLTTQNETVVINGTPVTSKIVDPAFSTRPVAFKPIGGTSDTLKFMIVMADGANYAELSIPNSGYNQEGTASFRSQANADYFDDSDHFYDADSSTNNSYRLINERVGDGWVTRPEAIRSTKAQGDTLMQNMCTAAKNKGIIIYTIGTDIPLGTNASNQMRLCASTPGQFYSVGSNQLEDAFVSIANAIQKLRLVN